MELSFAKGTEPVAETSLCFPGKVFDPAGSSFLSLGKLGADFRWDTIVCGLFDEDPTGVRITTFTDLSLSLAGATGVFSRDEPEEGHEFLGVFEAAAIPVRLTPSNSDEMLLSFFKAAIKATLRLPENLELAPILCEAGKKRLLKTHL